MKHPYAYYLKDYLEFASLQFADSTMEGRERRLNQLKGIIYDLHAEGKVSTVSPRLLTTKDIAYLLGYRKKRVSMDTVLKDVSALEGFLTYCGNDVISKFKKEYPKFIPKGHHKRNPSLTYEQVHRIIACAGEVDTNDLYRMRSFAVTMFCLCGGLRNIELRNAKLSNIRSDENGLSIWLEIVKGKETYGEARWVPLLTIGKTFFDRYFVSRELLLKELGLKSDALIPSLVDDAPFPSEKTLRKLKDHTARDIGLDFDLRILRRTYAQYLVDSGVDYAVVQVAMGHNNPNTTFKNYAGVRTERVPDLVFKKLLENQNGGV